MFQPLIFRGVNRMSRKNGFRPMFPFAHQFSGFQLAISFKGRVYLSNEQKPGYLLHIGDDN